MDLKAHVDPEDDWRAFAAWVRAADVVWLPTTQDGFLRGVFSFKLEGREHQGQSCVLLWPEYGYISPDFRKSVALGSAMLYVILRATLLAPSLPLYLVGTGYLSSYLSISQVVKTSWVYDEPSMSPWEQSLWRSLAEVTPGYNPKTKLFSMKTIPKNPRTSPPSDPKQHEPWRRYLAHNPRWTEGYTCLLMGKSDLRAWQETARWFARQPLRLLQGR
jgi:hypothetical protein